MKIPSVFYTVFFTALLGISCVKKHDIEDQRYTWSTEAPLTIPFRTRIQRFEKGNLLRNPSFETGRTFIIDSATRSFVLDGWQLIGQHVEWTDVLTDSFYHSSEAFSGYHAVKIVRNNAFETDEEGEGIMSEYIKVIPGNYSLSMYLKLDSVFPVKSRLGIKMYDAVNIRLLYYDRNKMPVSSESDFPQISQNIDISFKSLSFANYNNIMSFGWGKVLGKSHYFPFPDGDIPTDAHYVRVFIGLKGKGKMWVDSVTFSYTDLNFSVAERMNLFTDTLFRLQQAIIPTPKHYTRLESVMMKKPGMKTGQMPLIVIPPDADKLTIRAAELLKETLERSINKSDESAIENSSIRIIHTCNNEQIHESLLVFSLGNTQLYKENLKELPQNDIVQHPQGYFIHSAFTSPHLVIISANNSTGIFYGVQTAIQLIDNKKPVFHQANIIDYPDIAGRYCAISSSSIAEEINHQSKYTSELLRYKFNGAFLLTEDENNPPGGNNLLFFSSKNLPDKDLLNYITLPALKFPDDSLLVYRFPDIGTNENPIIDIMTVPMNRISRPARDPLYIMPLSYNNQLIDNLYTCTITKPSDSHPRYVYTGSSFYSINTDNADVDRFIAITGSKPVFMDNSMLIYSPWSHYAGNDPYFPGKIRLYNIFEPYSNSSVKDLFPKMDTGMFLVNQQPDSEIAMIRLATVADFMWNANAYSKDLSLWKVLVMRYGSHIARALVTYADQYSLMLESFLNTSRSEPTTRNLKASQLIMNNLTNTLNEIETGLGSEHELVKELQKMNSQMLNSLNALFSVPLSAK
jgi:hypothetical protein